MKLRVKFFSYFRDLAGCDEAWLEVAEGATVKELLEAAGARFEGLAKARNCALVAVGVDYAERERVLKEGDDVAMFPPVQGG
jgi:molybdopterin converting factor small subunit